MTSLIHGEVRNREGIPVAQARVYFVSGPAPLPDIAALTNEEGRFTLSAPSAGAYMIECNADAHTTEVIGVNVEDDDQDVEFLLSPTS